MSSDSVLGALLSQLGPSAINQISQQLGVDQQTARTGIEAGLPLLLSALAQNTQSAEGAHSLANALAKDHDGSVLTNLDSVLGGNAMTTGDGILRHVLGSQRPQVEQGLSQQLGLDGGSLLKILAPVVLGQLGQMQRQQGMDAGQLANQLQREQQNLPQGGILDVLGSLLGAGVASSSAGSSSTGLEGLLAGGPVAQMLLSAFGPQITRSLAQRFGVSEAMIKKALLIAIPLLLAALARNSSSRGGADSLLGALTRDHDGSVMNDVESVFANPTTRKGDRIVKKVLGDDSDDVAQTITRATGVDGGSLLQAIAPIVMGILGQQVRSQGLDAGTLANTLQDEEKTLTSNNEDISTTIREVLGEGNKRDNGLLGMLGRLFGGQ